MVLRELLVKLGLDIDAQSFAKGHLAAHLLEQGLEKVVETAHELIHAFAENIEETIEYGDKVKKTSQSIGVAADALQELHYAGSLADVTAEDMSTSIGILSRNMLHAKEGSEEAAKAFKGIKFKEGGELLATDEVLGNIAEKFASMPDGAEKTALAMQLFGRSGKQMIPLLNKGREELEATRKEAQRLGLVMGDDAVEASEELNDNLHRLHAVTQGLWRSAIAPLIPAMNELVEQFLEWKKANGEWLKQKITFVVRGLVQAIKFLGHAFQFVLNIIKIFTYDSIVIRSVLVGIAAAFIAVRAAAIASAIATAAAWVAAAAPFIAIAAAIGAVLLLLDDIRGYYDGEDSLFGDFMKAWDDWMKPKGDDPWWLAKVKELLKLLGDAKQIIDDVGYWFKGVDYYEQKYKAKHPEQYDESGNYVGNQDKKIIPNSGGRVATIKRGEMSINGQVVRPELRTSAGGGGSSVSMGAPTVNIGPVHQQPGESGKDFADRVGDIVKKALPDAFQPILQGAVAGVQR